MTSRGANAKYHARVTYIASCTQYRGLSHRNTGQEGKNAIKSEQTHSKARDPLSLIVEEGYYIFKAEIFYATYEKGKKEKKKERKKTITRI